MFKQIQNLQQFNENIQCPVCGIAVLDWSQEQYIQPCHHTAFIAIDLGFEYISDGFEKTLMHDVDTIHDQEMSIIDEIKKSDGLEHIILFKMPLGVEGYWRYVGLEQKG